MFFDYKKYNYYIQPGRTDMRKGAANLVVQIKEKMHLDPFTNSIFIFCGSGGKMIKVIIWDGNGFWLMSKKLVSGTFAWPADENEAMKLKYEDIARLFSGEDIFRKLPQFKNGLNY